MVYRRIYNKALPFVIHQSQHISHCLYKTQSTSLLSVCEKNFISVMLGINGAKPCPMVLYHIVWIFTCYILWYQISWEYDAQRGDVTYQMVHRCKVISKLKSKMIWWLKIVIWLLYRASEKPDRYNTSKCLSEKRVIFKIPL